MSKIMELADDYAEVYSDSYYKEVKKERRAALQAEVEKLEQQVDGISSALTNANKVLNSVVTERDTLRKKLEALSKPVSMEPFYFQSEAFDGKIEYIPYHTASQLAAARQQGAEEERKKLNALLRQALDTLENFKNPDFSAEESFEQCEAAIAAIAEVKP